MENASKALIIAGAILISILLISLGIMIYNQARSITDSSAVDELTVTQFNEKFLQYEGTKTGAQVRSLLQQVLSSNANAENEDKGIAVTLSDGTGPIIGEGDVEYSNGWSPSKLRNTSKYEVTFTRSTDAKRNGLIETINIKPI